jgi:phage terminase small subunit
MARPRTPTKVLQLRGADKKNPKRFKDRQNEPEPAAGIGEASQHLSEAEQKIWDELVGLVPAGVLGNSDRIALERVSVLLYQARYEREEWTSSKEKDLIQYLSRFGMTPSDRSKISVPKPKGADPWEDL